MWSGALGSSDLLLSYHVVSLASHITNILIFDLSSFKHIYLYVVLQCSKCEFKSVKFVPFMYVNMGYL